MPVTQFEFTFTIVFTFIVIILLTWAQHMMLGRIREIEKRFDPKLSRISEFDQEDEIVVTGISNSGKRYVGLPGMVATVDKTPGEEALKIWPERMPGMPEIEGGKIWFLLKNIEKITITRKSDLV